MKISIVILTKNNVSNLDRIIKIISKFDISLEIELLVIDNNSKDGTVDFLNKSESVNAILNEKEINYSEAFNLALNKTDGKYILFLQQDAILTEKALNKLINCLNSSDEIAMVGPSLCYSTTFQSVNCEANNLEQLLCFSDSYNESHIGLSYERITLSNSCFIVKREVVDKVGYFDEAIGGYSALDDYCYRIRRKGYKLIYSKDTFVYNNGNSSFFESENRDYEDKLFEEKWGFKSSYSNGIREDMISLFDKNYEEKITVLEVGCACGGTLLEIKNLYKNAQLFGLELNGAAAKCAGMIAEAYEDNIETSEINFEEEKFDYILFGDVLEHLYSPEKVLKKVRRFLKPTGKIVASIPNVMHYSILRQLIFGRWKYEDAGILDRTHIRFFTYTEIIEMFKACEYENINIRCNPFIGSQEDEEFINVLTSISNENFDMQYKTYQYVLTANKLNKDEILGFCLKNITSNKNYQEIETKLDDFSVDEILSYINKNVSNKVEMLNSVGVYNFNKGKYEEVIPFFSQALAFDNKNKNTLFNLGVVLFSIGEYTLSKDYFQQIEEDDNMVKQYLEAINEKIEGK